MSDRYHYNKDGGYTGKSSGTPPSNGDWGGLFQLALLVGVIIFITTFWHIILAVVLGLAAAGGFGTLIWKLKGNFFKLKAGLLSFRFALARCERRRKSLSTVEARKPAMSSQDFRKAVLYAKQQLAEAVERLNYAGNKVDDVIDTMRRTIREARENVLKRAPTLKEEKLKRLLDKLAHADAGLTALADAITTEVRGWSRR